MNSLSSSDRGETHCRGMVQRESGLMLGDEFATSAQKVIFY